MIVSSHLGFDVFCTPEADGCGFLQLPVEVKPLLGESASCSASDFAYCYTFRRSVVCRLSVVCHIRAPCLNRLTDLDAIWQVHLWGPVAHCVRWGVADRQEMGSVHLFWLGR